MAMDPMDREPNVYNRETNVYDNTGRGSNTLAYVIGGLVVALGLLAFSMTAAATSRAPPAAPAPRPRALPRARRRALP